MVWVGATIILGILIGIRLWKQRASDEYRWDPAYREFTGFSRVIFGGILGFLAGLLVVAIMNPPKSGIEVLEYKLGSIRDSGTTGTFFLGTGNLEDGAYYRYYVMSPSGGYKLQTLRSGDDRVTVFQEIRTDAVLRIRYKHDVFKHENTLWTIGHQGDEWQPLSWEFHIPLGTIQPVFSLR